MSLSIVIVSFNRKKVLQKLLRSLEVQSDMAFEVIVVVDGSTDGTQLWLKKYKQRPPFKLRWFDTGLTDRYGLAVARNIGIREAKSEAVVILDDDSFPTRNFVAEHKKSVKRKVLTGGWRTFTDPYARGDERMQEYLDTYGDCSPGVFRLFKKQKHKYVVENNTCMYRQDWIDVGLFDETVSEYGVIAYDFLDRLKEKGYKYQFNPRAEIIHKDEYKRSYGDRKKDPHTIPVWLKHFVHPCKEFLRVRAPRVYSWLKHTLGRSI